jgi:ribosome-associated protein
VLPASRIPVNNWLFIDESELQESFVRASGPGGQNVNKTSSAVQLRFDVRNSPNLPPRVKERLERIAGKRLTLDGVIVISAQRFGGQEANRRDAVERLVEMIREAAVPPPPPRRPTKPTKGSQRRRLDGKSIRGEVKRLRRDRPDE